MIQTAPLTSEDLPGQEQVEQIALAKASHPVFGSAFLVGFDDIDVFCVVFS